MKLLNTRIIVYLIALLAVLAAMVSLRHCSSPNSDRESGGDTIDVSIEYSPLSCYMYDDTLGGFEYDLIRAMARHGGATIKYHPSVALHSSIEGLERGTYDVLIAQIPATTDMKEQFLFTDAVYLDRQILVQLRDSVTREPRARSILDLAGDTIRVVKDSPMEDRIHNLIREIGDTIYIDREEEYTGEQLVMMVATGQVKYAVVNQSTAAALAGRYPLLDIGQSVSFTQFQSWALRKTDSELCDSLNSWLRAVKASGEYDAISAKYFK